MRILQVNPVYDRTFPSPDALLDRYTTLTEWSEALTSAGASVTVAQRFHTSARVTRNGVTYAFIKDSAHPWLSTADAPPGFVAAIGAEPADVIHVNGLIFPQLVAAIRRACGDRMPIVAQHHGGEFPVRGSGLMGYWLRKQWRAGLACANALSFTAAAQAQPWRDAGVLDHQRVIEVVEAGTTMRTVARNRAELAIGMTGDPLILWVGRLTTNKDPLTVLDGIERALPQLPHARVAMVFGDDTLLHAVLERVDASPALKGRVILSGEVARDEMPNYYSAADIFVSGSHFEGSGYALIEAMAASVIPVVTDIPSFGVITGNSGRRWPVGDASALAESLIAVSSADRDTMRERVRAQFTSVLDWRAIAGRTLSEYRSLAAAMPGRA